MDEIFGIIGTEIDARLKRRSFQMISNQTEGSLMKYFRNGRIESQSSSVVDLQNDYLLLVEGYCTV